ncbi:MAG: DUF5615 family PIN-like protein [Terriglobia bacterium]
MRVLLDTCLSHGAKEALAATGHNVVWGGDCTEDALKESRILITLDKDLGELAARRRLPHCGILRLVGFKASDLGSISQKMLADHGDDLQKGAIVTAEPGRLRIRYSPPAAQN